ncbi:MAG TPA: histone deacetylase [Solirubrobacterales bacterium]|nr:histone deacetylase [Solirubrobacterales bacterium]
MLYFSDPSSLDHDPRDLMPGHPESPPRLVAIERRLAAEDWLGWERRPAPAASAAELELVHTPRHVAAIRALSEAGGGAIDVETYAGPRSYGAAAHAAGGAAAMARALLAGEAAAGFSAARPPGHHAEAERAMGFCLFDSIAVAAALAVAELGAARVLILDWDVHHGNGTEAIFEGRDDVLPISIHQERIWPGSGLPEDVGTGAGSGFTINLPVPEGSGRDVFLSLLDRVVGPVATEFAPDLILVSAGYDAHRDDPLAGLALTSEDFGQMTVEVRELASRLGIPVGAVLEGGYAPAALAGSVEATMRALAGAGGSVDAPRTAVGEEAAARVSAYWPAARG